MAVEEEGKRRQVVMPDEMWEKLKVIARADTTSSSAVIRIAVRDYIAKRASQARAERKEDDRDRGSGYNDQRIP